MLKNIPKKVYISSPVKKTLVAETFDNKGDDE